MREGRAEGGAKVGLHICVEYSIMFSLAHRERGKGLDAPDCWGLHFNVEP